MKIKTLLLFVLIFVIFSFIFLTLSLVWAYKRVETSQAISRSMNSLEYSMTGLKQLTMEYMILPGPRVDSQWEKQMTETNLLLSSLIQSYPREKETLTEMKINLDQIQTLFHSLVELETASPAGTGADKELPTRMAGQLMVRAQDIVTRAFLLQNKYTRELIATQKAALLGITMFVFILALVVSISFYVLYRKIISPLVILRLSTQKIGSGDLKHRIPVRSRDEIGELTDSFNEMTAKLETVDTLKSNFLMVAAHQLRTPLGIIRWSAEVLRDAKSKNDRDKMLEQIHSAALRMTRSVSELIDVARIDQGQIINNPEKIEVASQMHDLVEEIRPLLDKKHIALTANIAGDDNLTIFADPRQFAIVIRNLLSNAVTYTNQNGKIEVNVRKNSGLVEIRVSDTGIGIPADIQQHIFSKFFRALNAISHSPDGSGLGLYIVNSFVRSWGGTVTFTSQLGKGTAFTVLIPISQGKQA